MRIFIDPFIDENGRRHLIFSQRSSRWQRGRKSSPRTGDCFGRLRAVQGELGQIKFGRLCFCSGVLVGGAVPREVFKEIMATSISRQSHRQVVGGVAATQMHLSTRCYLSELVADENKDVILIRNHSRQLFSQSASQPTITHFLAKFPKK